MKIKIVKNKCDLPGEQENTNSIGERMVTNILEDEKSRDVVEQDREVLRRKIVATKF